MQQRGQGSSSKSNPKKFKLLQKDRDAAKPSAAAGHSGHILGVRRFARALARGIGIPAKGSKVWQALQESEEFSSSLLGNSPFPIIVINPDTSVKYVNPALEKLTGFTSAELTGRKAPYPWWTEETLQKTEKDLGEAMHNGAQKLEELFQTKNGDRFWVEITSRPVKKDGKIKYYLANWVDITERKRAREALRESEERYKDIVENAGVAICADDKNGNITYFNQEFADLFGYSIEEIKRQSHKTLLHPDDLRIVSEFHKRRMQGEKEPSRYEFKGLKKDGSVIHLEVVIGSILTKGGSIIGIRNYFWDITERKRAEEAVRESEGRYKTLLENLPKKIFLKDKDSIYISCNQHYARDLRIEPDEIVGKTDYDFYPKELAEKYRADDKRIVESGKTEDIEEVYIRDGQDVWVHTVKTPVKDDKGNVTGVLGIFRDITERKRAEKALQEQYAKREELERIINRTPAVVFLWKAAEGWPVEFVSENVDQFGYKPQDFYSGEILYDKIVHPDDLERVASEVTQHSSQEIYDSFTQEYRIITKTGEIRWVDDCTWIRRDKDGLITHYQGIIVDITERKMAEEMLRETTNYLQNLIDYANAPIIVWGPALKITKFNHAFEHLTGCTADEVIGQELRVLFPEVSRDESLSKIARTVGGEYWESVEIPILCKNGNIRLVLWNSANICAEDGTTYLATIAQGTDITERKQAEDALKQTTEELKTEREELTEMNLVFKHVIEHIEQERQEYKQQICQDVEQAAIPVLTRLKEKIGPAHANEFEALQTTLKAILAKDIDKFRERYVKLTPRELEICEMIKEGFSSKEIADSLNLSVLTIHKHREEIRRKLGITNKAVNLGTYLRTR